ncbi:hypothetical protein [Kitasatospora sp. NPDC088548]|uniref:hypothetical protein n=1 Tax=Kitasatospora sp. NPDC088548 TaxID=3364075 RepID=UPI003822A048
MSSTTPVNYLAFVGSPDGFAGLAFMVEAWAAPMDSVTPEEEARRAAGERTFLQADREGRREARMFTAVDINGHAYILRRLQGEPAPRLGMTGADKDHRRSPPYLGFLGAVSHVRDSARRLV